MKRSKLLMSEVEVKETTKNILDELPIENEKNFMTRIVEEIETDQELLTTNEKKKREISNLKEKAIGAQDAQAIIKKSDMPQKKNGLWVTRAPKAQVDGGSLRTWSYITPDVEKINVFVKTNGRPLNCSVELWEGEDDPMEVKIYSENGNERPFHAVFETPGRSKTLAVRNIGDLELPAIASVEPVEEEYEDSTEIVLADGMSMDNVKKVPPSQGSPRRIQGGSIRNFPFPPYVQRVRVRLESEYGPIEASVELLQGPNQKKTVMEVYVQEGADRGFFALVDTPGEGNVVRIVNNGNLEFPLMAIVEADLVAAQVM
eukprot:CAMPEP_0202458726 /NCGR_PEP_ID=MMETSP1360-20130828/27501_1 /ASSEMBLY_ACC=CAM_ASM_000848 /TAXON_ID=515479 /ORGANISM="Licmophora paradoxa, Strain CCMP2313" /LENGTH=315 /DNA_ID=CAMNT_0049079409 /DNA_START=168 /DNA_END=1115 /DNA_ORIENTATION=-